MQSVNEQLLQGDAKDVRFPLSSGTLLKGQPNTVHPSQGMKKLATNQG